MRQVYIKSPIFVWEIFPRILGKRPKGILRDDVESFGSENF